MEKKKIYLDYASTTPCDSIVVDEMMPYFSVSFGNPNSIHKYGDEAADALIIARNRVSNLINATEEEIIFTSGATESSAMIIERTMMKMIENGINHFITLKSEHKSILDCAKFVENYGGSVQLLDVEKDGLINFNHFLESLKNETALVSVCFVNNETGVLQNIKKIAQICREHNVLLHTDATQAFGKIPIDVVNLGIDFLSASGHKIYGPKGIGILFCKKFNQKLLKYSWFNNNVEFGLRPGTVPVPLCVGLGKAALIAKCDMKNNLEKITNLRKLLLDGLFAQLEELYIHGSEKNYPGILNISFRGCEGEALMMEAKRIAISSGSACASHKLSISHVLAAMNVAHDIAQSSLRITIGKNTSEQDIDIAVEDLVLATRKLRAMSPIWDMIQEGIDIDKVFKCKSN